jgi:ABC-type microcin C transport system permease subunit YejE
MHLRLLTTFIRYTLLIAGATAVGPLVASFIVQYSQGGWVDYMWVCAALAGANTLAIFLFYPESNFNRPEELHPINMEPAAQDSVGSDIQKTETVMAERISRYRVSIVPKSWLSIWSSFITVNHTVNGFQVWWRPLIMFSKPCVLLAVFIYGTSLAAQIILM